EKHCIKANVEQHLLGLATGTIKPTSDPLDPDFLTSKCLLTSTSDPPENQINTIQTATSSSPSTNITRLPTPPQPAFNHQGPPSPFIRQTMSGSNPKEDKNLPSKAGSNAPPSMEDFLKAVLATQQATMAQAQADRQEYNRLPQTDPEAMIRQANAEKRRIKANIEQHLLGLATGTIKPPSDSFDPDFLTSKSFLTNTSNTPTDQLDTTQTSTSSSSPVNPTRHPMPPQPTLNPQDPPSPFLQRTMSGKNMETGGIPVNKTDAGDQKMVPPLTTMEYLNALLATQQATLAQAQADREEYARQDADAAACLAEIQLPLRSVRFPGNFTKVFKY
ncbi:hypothetical protein MJO28_016486, partial [Puccinia striiformis f. sp. tritici]